MLGKILRGTVATRISMMPMRRYAESDTGTIDVNMSQGQATEQQPGQEQKQMQTQKEQRGVGRSTPLTINYSPLPCFITASESFVVFTRRKINALIMPEQRRREGLNLFDTSGWLPSLFRTPNPFDLFNASEFPLFSDQQFFSSMTPRVDIYETDNEYHIDVEIPGMKKENLKIRLEDDFLTISGERSFEKTEGDKKARYRRMERSYGSFQRSFELPEGVDVNKIEAKYENGVLKVTVPKPETEEVQGRHIEIKEV